ncbi:MAG: hypothetical protein EOS21_22920 [Mesorhizobium sp.]|nr:MAG: hypothetical protein EOS21_22920 [Mesorhizobium sp.]
MLTISNKEQLKQLKEDRSLVTLFLDSGYSNRNISLILDAKDGFDAHVGSSWHMLIPYRREGYVLNIPIASRDYGILLSRNIIDEQGIPSAELPVILFENFGDESEYYYVSLANMSDDEIIRAIEEIADIVVYEFKNGRRAPDDFRQDVTSKIKAHTNKKKILRFVKKSTSTTLGVVGAAAGLFG